MLGAIAPRDGRRLAADPVRFCVAMAPQDREVVRHDPADVERGPIGARDILLVELPQPRPVLPAVVGMAIEVEEHSFRRAAPDILQLDPVKPGVGVEVFVHTFEQPTAIFRRTADQPGSVRGQVCHRSSNQISDVVNADHDAELPKQDLYRDTTLIRHGARRMVMSANRA